MHTPLRGTRRWLPRELPAPAGLGAPGRAGWHELVAADRETTFAFYVELFGGQKAGSHVGLMGVSGRRRLIVLSRPDQLACRFTEAENAVVEWLEARDIALREPPSPRKILAHAVAVAERHGVGRRALSNFDCFHYACARAAGEPLLTLDRRLCGMDVETRP